MGVDHLEAKQYYMLDNKLLVSTKFVLQEFRRRWKEKTGSDWNDEDSTQKLLNGKDSLDEKATSLQKWVLKSIKLEEWDISILSFILHNYFSKITYAKENKAVAAIEAMRKNLASIESGRISEKKSIEVDKAIEKNLKCLGVTQPEMDEIFRGKRDPDMAVNLQYWSFPTIESHQPKGNYSEAIELHTKTIETPNILPGSLSLAYERRSKLYLAIFDNFPQPDEAAELMKEAFLDAKETMKLNDMPWWAHYVAGRYHKLEENQEKAIHHFQYALELAPSFPQKEKKLIQAFLNCCQSESSNNTEQLHIAMEENYNGVKEETEQSKIERRITREINKRKGIINVAGEKSFQEGKSNYLRATTAKEFDEAIENLRTAAKRKHAEAENFLGKCYEEGKGIEKNEKEAFDRYNKVASMDVHSPGGTTLYKFNVGVATSQNRLGEMCHDEKYGRQDFNQAFVWYDKAMKLGSGLAACSLGSMYYAGEGIKEDRKMAELCWKESINLKNPKAYALLVDYYLEELETKKAFWANKFLHGFDKKESLENEEFDDRVKRAKKARKMMQGFVHDFEHQNNLNTKGLTFFDRLRRALVYMGPNSENKTDIIKGAHEVTKETITEAFKRATGKEGSKTAKKFTKIYGYTLRMCRMIEGKEKFPDGNENRDIIFLKVAYSLLHRGFRFFPSFNMDHRKLSAELTGIMEELELKENCEEDRKLRLSYIFFCLFEYKKTAATTSTETTDIMEKLKEEMNRYYDNSSYYTLICSFLNISKDYKLGLQYAEEGLAKYPKNVELMFLQAVLLSRASFDNNKFSKCEKILRNFISMVPPDDPCVPDAWYLIAGLYLQKLENEGAPSRLLQSKQLEIGEYIKLGQKAEKIQLPCYLPYKKIWIETDENRKHVLERKPYLKGPTRQGLIKLHRLNLKERMIHGKKKHVEFGYPSDLTYGMEISQDRLKPISLEEMNPYSEKLHEGRVIQLTFLDRPIFSPKSLLNVAEDENGDVTRVLVCNYHEKENFSFGCRIEVMNPYMSVLDMDEHTVLKIDCLRFVRLLKGVKKMCGFCGEENSSRFCSSGCKRPYCSEECERLDLERHDHKLACQTDK